MKVLLLSPASSITYKAFNVSLPPIGLLYIAGNLLAHGHRVEIIDENADYHTRRLDLAAYDLIGIGSNTGCFNRALSLAAAAKRQGKFVVLGGYHPTFTDRETLATGVVDAVVRGEGEEIMAQLADALDQGRDYRGLPGLSCMQEGGFRRNGGNGLIEELDSLPLPARHLVDMRDYATSYQGKRMTSLLTSRGCSYDCRFCSVSKFNGRRWRARAPVPVVDEMEEILRRDPDEAIIVVDDNFTIDPRRVDAICDEILRRGLKPCWFCMSRSDTLVRNPSMVSKMARSGCSTVFLGIESADDDILQRLNKRSTVDITREAISLLRKERIMAYGSFMLGDEQETEKTVRRTISFSRSAGLEFAQFSILTPFPGSQLYDDVRDRITQKNWDHYDGTHSVFTLEKLRGPMLEKRLYRAYAAFYLQPRVVWRLLRDIATGAFPLKTALRMLMLFLKRPVTSGPSS